MQKPIHSSKYDLRKFKLCLVNDKTHPDVERLYDFQRKIVYRNTAAVNEGNIIVLKF